MRPVPIMLGLLTLALIWAGPLIDVWRTSFAAHMLAHMGVVAIAAPLIAVGVSAGILPMAACVPVIASLVELVVVWGWHAPTARLWVEGSAFATILEQASFLAAGLFLWVSCIGPRETPARDAAGAFALLLTSVHMTLLGALLSLASRPLYGDGEVTCFGLVLGAQQDQALGGIIMLMIGAAVYLAGGVLLLARLLNGRTERLAD